MDVAVIGGGNSAVEAAIDLWRGGSRVSLIHRRKEYSKGIKYWVVPDIRNRLEKREINGFFESQVSAIREDTLEIMTPAGKQVIPNDFVFPLIGYTPDFSLLGKAGITINTDTGVPEHNPATFETPRKGVYVCGSIAAGNNANSIFIENGKLHAKPIIDHIVREQ
jgi:thioredoxin reductase (NADPH)